MMYGDKQILRQDLPAMIRWVEWCRAHSTNLIRDRDRGRDYGDWLSQGEIAPKDLIGTAYFAYSTSLVAKACRAVGDNANADKYQELFGQIKDAFDKRYVTADGHVFGGTQSGYCMALRFDLLPDNLRAKADQYLEENVKRHNDHLTTGFIGVGNLLPALCSENKFYTAYNVFLQDTFPSWLFSVKQGATTIWERWDGYTPERGFQASSMNSFNHYSLGSVGQWLYSGPGGIGIDQDRPGFKHFFLEPQFSTSFSSYKATLNSPYGLISSAWRVENDQVTYDVTVPPNTSATLTLPALANDGTALKATGAPMTRGDGGKWTLTAGTYEFSFAASRAGSVK